MKKMLFIMAVLGLGLSSCKKEEDNNKGAVPNSSVKSFDDVTVPKNFDWKTDHEVTISIKGLENDLEVLNKIVVKSADGVIFATRTARSNEDLDIVLTLPKALKTVVLQAGEFEKEVDIMGNRVSFDYIPAADETNDDSDNPVYEEGDEEIFDLD